MRFSASTILIASIVVSLMIDAGEAHAQAWVKPAGESYLKLSAGTFRATGTYDIDGNFEENPIEYENTSLGLYAEVGLTSFLALSISTAFYRAVNTVEERTRYINNGPGDLALGLYTPLAAFSYCSTSAGVVTSFPLYSGVIEPGTDVAASGVTGADRFTPALGDGSIDVTPNLNLGCGLPWINGWASTSVGYQARLRGFGDSLTYGANVGSFVWPERLALTASIGGVQRLVSDAERPTKSFLNVGGGMIVRIWGPLAIEGNFSSIVNGAFTSRGWSASVGVSYSGEVW